MQLSDVIGSIRRHWRISVAILLLTAAALGLFLFTRSEVRDPDRWRASVQVLVPVRTREGEIPAGVPPSLLQGQTSVALSGTTKAAALKNAEIPASEIGDFDFSFATPPPSTDQNAPPKDILTLSAAAADYNVATKLAVAYASAYIDARRTIVASGNQSAQAGARKALVALDNRLDQVTSEIRDADPTLLARIDDSDPAAKDKNGNSPPINLPAGTPLDTVLLVYERRTLIDQIAQTRQTYADNSIRAIVPSGFATIVETTAPVQITPPLPTPVTPVAIALAIGLLLAVAVPVLIDRLDHTIRDPRTAGNALSAVVLSTIPATSGGQLAAIAKPGSRRDRAYRALAATSAATDELPRAIVVTSPVGVMQDNVAANFAAALASLGLRVALIATDARQSWFVDSTGSPNASTLPELLALARVGRLNGQIRDSLVPTHLENLAVMVPGTTVAGAALLDGMPALLEALAGSDIDVTVIAGPSLLEDPSATIFAWSTRSVLWVVESGEITEQEAREAASRLALAGATPFGVAMVDAKD